MESKGQQGLRYDPQNDAFGSSGYGQLEQG
jgi:hypothetical protein